MYSLTPSCMRSKVAAVAEDELWYFLVTVLYTLFSITRWKRGKSDQIEASKTLEILQYITLYLVRRLVEVDEYGDGDLAQEDYDEEDEELKHDLINCLFSHIQYNI